MSERLYAMKFSDIYQCYVEKVSRKGRTTAELDTVISWLTGYNTPALRNAINSNATLAQFFENAPQIHPNAYQIKGSICGVRIVDIEDHLMQKIRWLDKLVDELAQSKSLDKILRC
jgi:hypothetical protein